MNQRMWRPRINFVLESIGEWQDVIGSDGAKVKLDDLAPRIRMGREIWIVQAFHELRARGWSVTLSDEPDLEAVNILHADDLQPRAGLWCYFIVSIRADRDPSFISQMEIVQNETSVWSRADIHIPHWPQPGLIPRKADRGSRIDNVVYMGNPHQLDESFTDPRFQNELRALGVSFDIRSHRWWDYSDADIVLAVRDGSSFYRAIKPASKLVNAWQAGCPAILSPEAAYRELRRSPLDFVEVATPRDALEAIRTLKHDPTGFQRIVDRGIERGRGFERSFITDRWEEVLSHRVVPRFLAWQERKRQTPIKRLQREYLRRRIRRRVWGTRVVPQEGSRWRSYLGWIRRRVTLPESTRAGVRE